MRRPFHPARAAQRCGERLDDLGLALEALRRALLRGDRVAVETACWTLRRRLTAAPLEDDDGEEIAATVGLIEGRVRYGVHERLRRFLLPLAAALLSQIEEAERDL